MAINARKHATFGPDETPTRAALNTAFLTVNDIVPVANSTERAQLVADLTDAGYPPSPSRPLVVDQADHGVLYRTTNGTTWRRLTAFAELEGTTVVSSSASATGNPEAVTFPAGLFTVAPIVTPQVANSTGQYNATCYDITATGMKVNIYRTTGAVWSSGQTVHWQARQALATSAAG